MRISKVAMGWRGGLVMILAVAVLATAAGCSDAPYAFYAVVGQLDLVCRTRPLDQVLSDGTLNEAQRAKVREILAIRDFAANRLGLHVNDSYTAYLDTGGQPVAWNLSASAKDSLTPVLWTFPLAGAIPYLGFFDRQTAADYQLGLVAQGYDTVLYPVEAYSTLGLFADPITTTMLERSEAFLADLLIHESTHNTVWRHGSTDFNENAATFVGRIGAILYLSEKYGADSDVVTETRQKNHDEDLYNRSLSDLLVRLTDYYASDLPSADKIAGRAAVFEESKRRFIEEIRPQMHYPENYDFVLTLNYNNAWVLVNARYSSDLSAFQAVYDAVGQDFARALEIFLAAAGTDDPFAYLRAQVAR